jgi:hypothetical protein
MKINKSNCVAFLFCISGCTGVKTTVKQIENQSFLELVGSNLTNSEQPKIFIDENPGFNAKVNDEYSDRPKGIKYAIPTGLHHIKITIKGKEIFSEIFFISSQETKKILIQ